MNIDAFVAQPYPLEHSTDGETWQLVIGWTGEEDGIMPVLASELPGHYRTGPSRPSKVFDAVALSTPSTPPPAPWPTPRTVSRAPRGSA